MRLLLSLAALVAAAVGPAAAVSSTGSRVLVALEKGLVKTDYSHFWADLEGRGFELTFKAPKDESPKLVEFGERQFDHVILFTPSTKKYSDDLSPQQLVAYLSKQGGNILVASSAAISEFNRDFAREFGLEFQPADSHLIDHQAFSPELDRSDVPHTAVVLPCKESHVKNAAILSASANLAHCNPVIYRGVAHSLPEPHSPLLVPILHGLRSSYSAEPRIGEGPDDSPYPDKPLAGSSAGLVSGFQTLENSRIVFAGSVDLFSDAFFHAKVAGKGGVEVSSGNRAFVRDLTQWVFQESGVLRIVSATHHRQDDDEERSVYRIKDDLTYEIQVQTFQPSTSSWGPIRLTDLQLDFTMLDPHVRADLHPVSQTTGASTTKYAADFRAPDRHGVFKFLVDYKRPGWTFLKSSQTVSLVPFRHDEYPRFISGAYPFYASTFSTVAAFGLFAVLWLAIGGAEKDATTAAKKTPAKAAEPLK